MLQMVHFSDENKFQKKITAVHHEEEEMLLKALSGQYGLPYINLKGYTIKPEALLALDKATAQAAQIIPFEVNFQTLSVAIHEPNNPKTQHILEQLRAEFKELKVYLCSSNSIAHGLERYGDQSRTSATKKGVLDIDVSVIEKNAQTLKQLSDVSHGIESIRSANSARRVSETLEFIFAGALALGASDVHIEPEEDGIRLRYRLDGVLQDVIDMEQHIYGRLMSRLKLLSGMVINQTHEAQDGRFTFTFGERDIEIRSSVIPGASGESIVMRLLDPSVASFTLEKLGLNEQMYNLLNEQLKRPNGMVVTTGPTGSGKTTVLYALLQKAHTNERKIITIENPVEYKLDGIVQTQTEEGYSFASGLRAILRQDPDIIMVGEIRDNEVAATAIHAAQTGHLVFSTLHTNHAAGSFPRLIDLGVDPRVIGSSVNLVLAQRLVRVLCPACKRKRTASEEEARQIKQILTTHPQPPSLTEPIEIYEPVGCPACDQTGFSGRMAVFEAILIDEAVEEAVINDPREHIITEAAKPQGIPTMAEDGISKVLQGETSLTELQRVVDLTIGRHAYLRTTDTSENGFDLEDASLENGTEKDPDTDDEFNKHIV